MQAKQTPVPAASESSWTWTEHKKDENKTVIDIDQASKQKYDPNWQDELAPLSGFFNISECDPEFADLLKTDSTARRNLLEAHDYVVSSKKARKLDKSTNAMVDADITPTVAIKSGADVKIYQPELNKDVSPATFELVVSYRQTEIGPRIEVLNGVRLQLQTRDINTNSRMQIMEIQT